MQQAVPLFEVSATCRIAERGVLLPPCGEPDHCSCNDTVQHMKTPVCRTHAAIIFTHVPVLGIVAIRSSCVRGVVFASRSGCKRL